MPEQHKSVPLLPPVEPSKEFTQRVMAAIMAEPAPSWEIQYDTAKQTLNTLAKDQAQSATQLTPTASTSGLNKEAIFSNHRSHHVLVIWLLGGIFAGTLLLYLLPEITLEVLALVTQATKYVVTTASFFLSILYTVGEFLTHMVSFTGSFLTVTTKLWSIWATLWQVVTTGPLVGITLLFGVFTLFGQTLVLYLLVKRPART